MQDQAAWEAAHGIGADPEVFRSEVLSRLQGVSLGVMADATGLPVQHSSLIRRGPGRATPVAWGNGLRSRKDGIPGYPRMEGAPRTETLPRPTCSRP